jgi:hypothetical protein
VVDPGDVRGVQANRDELGQPLVLTDDAERAVAGIDEVDRGLHDPPQRLLQVRPGSDGDDRLQQAVHAVAGGDHGL